MQRLSKGFTLVEIMIVSTILVIMGLAILLTVNPLTQILKGYDSIRKADLDKIRIAFENYYEDHGCYPTYKQNVNDKVNKFTKGADGYPTYTCGSDIMSPYLEKMPCDPATRKPYNVFIDIHVASEKTCPSNFALYDTMANKFNPNLQNIPFCNDKGIRVVGNTGVRTTFLSAACYGNVVCSTFYGCKSGSCVVVSIDYPTCGSNYCSSDCAGRDCTNPANECK